MSRDKRSNRIYFKTKKTLNLWPLLYFVSFSLTLKDNSIIACIASKYCNIHLTSLTSSIFIFSFFGNVYVNMYIFVLVPIKFKYIINSI